MPGDTTDSSKRFHFHDHIGLRPVIGKWYVWRFLNTTGDVHPIHIHQSTFQPLGINAKMMVVGESYSAKSRTTKPCEALVPVSLTGELSAKGRAYEQFEQWGWKEVIRVNPSELVSIAICFVIPGIYVYHFRTLVHYDSVMMRPFVVTIMKMDDETMGGMDHHMDM